MRLWLLLLLLLRSHQSPALLHTGCTRSFEAKATYKPGADCSTRARMGGESGSDLKRENDTCWSKKFVSRETQLYVQ